MNQYTERFRATLLDVVEEQRNVKPHRGSKSAFWNSVRAAMAQQFPKTTMSNESLRSLYRRLTDPNVTVITKRKDDQRMGRVTIEDRLLNEIKSKRALDYLCKQFGVEQDTILAAVAKLQIGAHRGVTVWEENGVVFVQNITKPRTVTAETDLSHLVDGNVISFAVVSDTHFGSSTAARSGLQRFYDYVVALGINTVLHVGDLSDGYYSNRPTSIMEQDAVGFQGQLNMLVKEYPRRDGVVTYAISGNHDATYTRQGFANIGETLGQLRDDIVYLGHNYAKVWLTDKIDISLIHPVDGSSYSLTHKLQQTIERNLHRRSKLMFQGHYHKMAFIKFRGVYGWAVPSFQHKTQFMLDNNLESEVGGLIITLKLDSNGEILTVNTEYVDYSEGV